MTDINNVISEINRYQYNIKKGVIDELTKLDTRDFIEKEYEILKSLLKEEKKETEVAKEIRKAVFGDGEVGTWNVDTDSFLEKIIRLNKASMAYDRYLINLNCKYHVFYSGEKINVKNIMSYNHKPLDINEGNNLIILDRHNTHARIINYDNNEVNYIDIPRRNFALSPEKLICGSKYTLDDEVNDLNETKCDDDPDFPWLCNGLYHSIYHSIKNVENYDNIVVPIINTNYSTSKKIGDEMEKLLKEENNIPDYFDILNDGKIAPHNESNFSDCTVRVIKKGNKKITIIGLVLFDRISYIYNIFKDDISDDYNDVINQFIDDDTFNKIKDNYTKFPNFVYKMCCLNYAIKYYLNYRTNINDLYYAAKFVFFSCFNLDFEGGIDKKNISEYDTNVAKAILNYIINAREFFRVNDNINKHWLNLNDLNKLGFIPKFKTGGIKIPKIGDSKEDKLEDVIPKYLEEIRNEIKRLHTAHNDFETMINEIIEKDSIPQSTKFDNKTIDTIKQEVIENNTGKLVCIPVFCMNRYTSSFNYKLMKSIIDKINKKIKDKAGVKEETLQIN